MSARGIVYLLLFLTLYGLSLPSLAAYTTIPTVIVTPNKITGNPLSNGPKTIITREDITTSGANSLTQVLQEFGGVQLQDTTGNGSQITLSMRGFGTNANSNTLLMLDGIPLTNPDLAPPDLNTIPLQEIKYIEIVSGSESVLYGDQAVGGVINIITQNIKKQQLTISGTTGSYAHRDGYAVLNDHIKKLFYSLGIYTQHADNYRVHNNYKQNLLTGNITYPYQTGSSSFDYKIADEDMQYPGALTAAQVRQNRRQASMPNDVNFFSDRNSFFHLHQQQDINNNWQVDLDLARRAMNGNGILTTPFTQYRTVYFAKPQLKGTIGKSLLLNGVELEDDRYHLNSLFGVTKDTQQKYALFSLFNMPITERLALLIGGRGAQQNSQTQTMTSVAINRALATTIGLTFNFTPDSKIYLRRAGSYRFPKADENANTPPGVNGLKTQTGIAYETGIDWHWQKLLSQFSLYQLNLRNEIAFDPNQTPQQPFGSNRNLDPTVRRGFSVTEKYQLTDKLTLNGKYNYVDARFNSGINSGDRIPAVAENTFNAGINYLLTQNWNVYTEAVYTGNQYPANDDANIAGKIGGYTVYNFHIGYQYKDLNLSFRVNNIFNKDYYLYTLVNTGTPGTFFYPAPGRNFYLTLKYAFA